MLEDREAIDGWLEWQHRQRRSESIMVFLLRLIPEETGRAIAEAHTQARGNLADRVLYKDILSDRATSKESMFLK